ncbi:MAG: hypothetical protein H6733_17880 [Alphaproteobacteria bacterium]|nr:hypothetical protein [Alphaproteobacteria bacterium]
MVCLVRTGAEHGASLCDAIDQTTAIFRTPLALGHGACAMVQRVGATPAGARVELAMPRAAQVRDLDLSREAALATRLAILVGAVDAVRAALDAWVMMGPVAHTIAVDDLWVDDDAFVHVTGLGLQHAVELHRAALHLPRPQYTFGEDRLGAEPGPAESAAIGWLAARMLLGTHDVATAGTTLVRHQVDAIRATANQRSWSAPDRVDEMLARNPSLAALGSRVRGVGSDESLQAGDKGLRAELAALVDRLIDADPYQRPDLDDVRAQLVDLQRSARGLDLRGWLGLNHPATTAFRAAEMIAVEPDELRFHPPVGTR